MLFIYFIIIIYLFIYLFFFFIYILLLYNLEHELPKDMYKSVYLWIE